MYTYIYIYIYVYIYIYGGVPKIWVPKSSIYRCFSIINQPFWGNPPFMKTPIYSSNILLILGS